MEKRRVNHFITVANSFFGGFKLSSNIKDVMFTYYINNINLSSVYIHQAIDHSVYTIYIWIVYMSKPSGRFHGWSDVKPILIKFAIIHSKRFRWNIYNSHLFGSAFYFLETHFQSLHWNHFRVLTNVKLTRAVICYDQVLH